MPVSSPIAADNLAFDTPLWGRMGQPAERELAFKSEEPREVRTDGQNQSGPRMCSLRLLTRITSRGPPSTSGEIQSSRRVSNPGRADLFHTQCRDVDGLLKEIIWSVDASLWHSIYRGVCSRSPRYRKSEAAKPASDPFARLLATAPVDFTGSIIPAHHQR